MTKFMANLSRWLLQFGAALVIALALLVGVARLLLPEASSFASDIKRIVYSASGFNVDFGLISAGISRFGPELRFSDVEVSWPDGEEVLAANEVAVSLNIRDLLTKGVLMPGQIDVSGSAINIEIATDGKVLFQGHEWRDYLRKDAPVATELPRLRLGLTDIQVTLLDKARGLPNQQAVARQLDIKLNNERIIVQAMIEPDVSMGRSLEIEAELPLQLLRAPEDLADDTAWNLRLIATDFRLDPWLRLGNIVDAPIIDSQGALEAEVLLEGRLPVSIRAVLDIERLQLDQPDNVPVVYADLEGEFDWRKTRTGWEGNARNLRIVRDEREWPVSDAGVSYRLDPDGARNITANASFLRLDDLMPLAQEFALESLQEAGITGFANGDVSGLTATLRIEADKIASFDVAADFDRLGYRADEPALEISGISGRLAATQEGGQLELATRSARLGVGQLFREVLDISTVEGLAVWRANAEGYRLIANGLLLETPDASGQASLELSTAADFSAPFIDLSATAKIADLTSAPKYLPKVIPEKVLKWVDAGLLAGRDGVGNFRLRGALQDFPFRNDEGEFRIEVDFVDAKLAYAPGWPVIEKATGQVVFDRESLFSLENSLSIAGVELKNANLRMADIRDGIILLSSSGPVQLDRLLRLLQASPINDKLGPVFSNVRAAGAGDLKAQLVVPVKDLESWQLKGQLDMRNASAWLDGISTRLTSVSGKASIRNTEVTASGLTGKLLGKPVSIDVRPAANKSEGFSHRAAVAGVLPYADITDALALPRFDKIQGESRFEVEALFPLIGDEAAQPFRLRIDSELEGISSDFPYPLRKPAVAAEALNVEVRFPESGIINIQGNLARGFNFAFQVSEVDEAWQLSRGSIISGARTAELPESERVRVSGYLDRVNLNQWIDAFDSPASGARPVDDDDDERRPWQSLFSNADLQIGDFDVLGYRFTDVDLDVDFSAQAWDVVVASPWLEGRLRVPYDFAGSDPLEFDLQRLFLLESLDDVAGDVDLKPADPTTLPALLGNVDNFALGALRLGALEADIRRIRRGYRSEVLRTVSKSFGLEISGDWLVVDNAQRSRLHAELQSWDVGETLVQLGYSRLIEAKSARVVSDLLWEGGPGMGMIYASTGTIDLTIREGSVEEVEAGGGRILGLLSVTSLPKRLSLDFSDITASGLVFDKIGGEFKLDFGNAWTCDLALEGEVTDIAVVGRTGLRAEDYEQVAVVRPHVSNLMPVSAAFLGGPTVGIAALLISQIFKKPLSGIGESYYTIRGSWDKPDFVPSDRSRLDTAAFADCANKLPELSPEERAAIEELLTSPTENVGDENSQQQENSQKQ